jgi:branched-chain amino acid transport system substrate-binding protein
MKRLLYISGAIVLITSFTFGGKTFAAHQARPSHANATLHLCLSFPFGVGAYADLANGIRRGVQLANSQWRARLKSVGVTLTTPIAYDDARADGVDYGTDTERNNALKCLSDSHAIAYIGTLNSGATLVSEPILNRAGMVMISPANTNPILTTPGARAAQEPATYNHTYKYVTYYRTVTTDSIQGPAGASFMKSLGQTQYYLVDDKQTYGAGLADKFNRYATGHLGMHQVGLGHIDPTSAASIAETADAVASLVLSSHAPAVYFGGNPPEGGPLLKRLRATGFTGPFVGGDALFNQSFITDNGNSTSNTYATSVGPDPLKTSKAFRKAYQKAFPAPFKKLGIGPYDAPAYDAAGVALTAIWQAAKHGKLTGSIGAMRKALIAYVHNVSYSGATGITSFDKDGDTTNKIISIYAVNGTAWKFRAYAPKVSIPPVP